MSLCGEPVTAQPFIASGGHQHRRCQLYSVHEERTRPVWIDSLPALDALSIYQRVDGDEEGVFEPLVPTYEEEVLDQWCKVGSYRYGPWRYL